MVLPRNVTTIEACHAAMLCYCRCEGSVVQCRDRTAEREGLWYARGVFQDRLSRGARQIRQAVAEAARSQEHWYVVTLHPY